MASYGYEDIATALLRGPTIFPPVPGDKYDFIIVGGGTAGLVLANRLTEDENISVLVLEAGEDLTAHPRVVTPALFATMIGSDGDWSLRTEPQQELNGRRVNMSLGRAVGGSSAISGQTFVLPSKASIDAWGELGNRGWDWESFLPYLKKPYTLNIPLDKSLREHFALGHLNEASHDGRGPIQLSFPNDISDPLPTAWVQAMDTIGHRAISDPLSGYVTGAFSNPTSIDGQRHRSYAASAYFKPVEKRSNLTTITGAYVQKILLVGKYPNVIATGIEYLKNSTKFNVRAKAEVILAAGSIHSAKLLELSGIGGSNHLDPIGIYPIIDNPNIGENMQDHPVTAISFEVQDGVQTMDSMLRLDLQGIQAAMKQYTTQKAGPLVQAGVNSYACLPFPEASHTLRKRVEKLLNRKSCSPSELHHPSRDYISHANTLFLDHRENTAAFFPYAAQASFDPEESGTGLVTSNLLPGNFYSISSTLLQPLSRGSTHIRSSNPSDPPKIDPRYLSHPLDLEIYARHMTRISKLVSTPASSTLLKPDGLRNTSAPKDLTSIDEMKDYIRKTASSSWSPSGTCAMLPEGKGGVVNEKFVVHGTRNLRVVDASVIPIKTVAAPMALVYAVAERAAAMVREELETRREGFG